MDTNKKFDTKMKSRVVGAILILLTFFMFVTIMLSSCGVRKGKVSNLDTVSETLFNLTTDDQIETDYDEIDRSYIDDVQCDEHTLHMLDYDSVNFVATYKCDYCSYEVKEIAYPDEIDID